MSEHTRWKSDIYYVEGAKNPYWALAGYTDATGVVHYSREGQYTFVFDAMLAGKDYARILGENGHTPESEGATFTSQDMPAGRFLSVEETEAAITAERSAMVAAKTKAPRFF